MLPALPIQKDLALNIFDTDFCNRHRLQPQFFTRDRVLGFGMVVSLILQKMTRSLAIEANCFGGSIGTRTSI